MFPRRKHLKILDRVVVFVLILVVDVFVRTKRPADHCFGYHPMFVTPEQFSICCWFHCLEAPNLGIAIVRPPHLDRRDVVRVSIPTDPLRVFAAEAIGTLFGGLQTERMSTKPWWLAGCASPHR